MHFSEPQLQNFLGKAPGPPSKRLWSSPSPLLYVATIKPLHVSLSVIPLYFKFLGEPCQVLFISLHVRAVELVILVKPIGILTHTLMSISFRTKIPIFLNISVLLKVVGISVIFLVLRFLIMPALILNLK